MHIKGYKKIRPVGGGMEEYVLSFGGSDGGPYGDRWSIYVTWPQIRWVETKMFYMTILGKHDWSLP